MIGFPFDSRVTYDTDGTPIYDRAITSEPYRRLLKKLFSTGVMPVPSNNMQVVAKSGMTVTVKAGFAMVEGLMKLEDGDANLTLENADTAYNRIDTIVLRLDDNENVRACEYAIKKGDPSASPVAPELQRSLGIYEIGLADVLVRKSTSTITNSNITDTRYDTERCGIVSSVSQFDTTTIYQQIQTDLAEFKDVEQAGFMEWFENLRIVLDGNVAGHLQNEIDDINNNIEEMEGEIEALGEALPQTTGAVKCTDVTMWPNQNNVPNVAKYGNVCVMSILGQLKAGSYAGYANAATLIGNVGKLPYIPNAHAYCIVQIGTGANASYATLRCASNGYIYFNNALNLSSDTWITGQCTYITNDIATLSEE